MIELNKRQYEILTFMANTNLKIYSFLGEPEFDDVWSLVGAALLTSTTHGLLQIAPHAREMFRDAGLRRIN
jgi:hypothetical protein